MEVSFRVVFAFRIFCPEVIISCLLSGSFVQKLFVFAFRIFCVEVFVLPVARSGVRRGSSAVRCILNEEEEPIMLMVQLLQFRCLSSFSVRVSGDIIDDGDSRLCVAHASEALELLDGEGVAAEGILVLAGVLPDEVVASTHSNLYCPPLFVVLCVCEKVQRVAGKAHPSPPSLAPTHPPATTCHHHPPPLFFWPVLSRCGGCFLSCEWQRWNGR